MQDPNLLRRHDDEIIGRISDKMDRVCEQMHTMEIHMAELKAIGGGRDDLTAIRLSSLEAMLKKVEESGNRLDNVEYRTSQNEITLKVVASNVTRMDNMEYRTEQLEGKVKSAFEVVYRFIAALFTAIAVPLVLWLIQQWGASGGGGHK